LPALSKHHLERAFDAELVHYLTGAEDRVLPGCSTRRKIDLKYLKMRITFTLQCLPWGQIFPSENEHGIPKQSYYALRDFWRSLMGKRFSDYKPERGGKLQRYSWHF